MVARHGHPVDGLILPFDRRARLRGGELAIQRASRLSPSRRKLAFVGCDRTAGFEGLNGPPALEYTSQIQLSLTRRRFAR
jgi:hypothetical protein